MSKQTIDLLKRFEIYYHEEYGESIVSGAIEEFTKFYHKGETEATEEATDWMTPEQRESYDIAKSMGFDCK